MVLPLALALLGGGLLGAGAYASTTKGGRDFLFGKSPKLQTFEKYSPQQQKILNDILSGGGLPQNQLYQQGNQYISDLLKGKGQPNLDQYFAGSQEAFAAPMMRQFNQEILPGIASRFGAMGTGGSGMMGSDFMNAATNAGASLQERLAAMQSGLQQQRAAMEMQKYGMRMQAAPMALGYAQAPYQNLMQALGMEMKTPYIQGGSQGFIPTAAAGLMSGLGQGLGMGMMGG